MSDADKSRPGTDDDDIADATPSGGADDTVRAADGDTVESAAADYSLAGDAAEAGVEAHPAPAAAATPGRKGRGAGFWAVVLLIVFLAGAAAWPVLGPLLPESFRPGTAPVDEAARQRLATLESELAALKAQPVPDSSAAVQDLQAKLATQADAMAALKSELASVRDAAAALPQVDLGPLQQRLEELSARVETLAAMPVPTGAVDGDGSAEAVSALRAQLAKVAEELAGIGENQAALSAITRANAELQQTVAALTSRLGELEDRAGDAAARRRQEAKVLALSQLAADLREGGGYADSLSAAQALSGGDAELSQLLAPLVEQADAGAPTLIALRQRFEQVAPEIVRAGIADAGGNWLDRTTNRLASLVTVRRVGEVSGDSVEAVVARAETRLGDGDLAAAVAQLEMLQGAPARAAEGWLAAARERLAATAAADKLQAYIAALVGAG